VQHHVVAGVHYGRDIGGGHDGDEPSQEAGGADATGESDEHARSVQKGSL
jgi:hypothetical protein